MYNNTNIFNLETALTIVQSNASEFKVDFDSLWQWCGYSTKANAKRTLESNFEEGFDFSSTLMKTSNGRPGELLMLTVDAAKEFAMLAQTEQGKQVRRYFIQAEKQLRQLTIPQLDPNVAALVQATQAMFGGVAANTAAIEQIRQETNEVANNVSLVTQTTQKFVSASGISIHQYLKSKFSDMTFGGTLVNQLGCSMRRMGYEVCSTYFEIEVGRIVNTYEPDAIEDCITELVKNGSIVMYKPSRGKIQAKWHTKVKAMKRAPKNLYTQEQALSLLYPSHRKEEQFTIQTVSIPVIAGNIPSSRNGAQPCTKPKVKGKVSVPATMSAVGEHQFGAGDSIWDRICFDDEDEEQW